MSDPLVSDPFVRASLTALSVGARAASLARSSIGPPWYPWDKRLLLEMHTKPTRAGYCCRRVRCGHSLWLLLSARSQQRLALAAFAPSVSELTGELLTVTNRVSHACERRPTGGESACSYICTLSSGSRALGEGLWLQALSPLVLARLASACSYRHSLLWFSRQLHAMLIAPLLGGGGTIGRGPFGKSACPCVSVLQPLAFALTERLVCPLPA